MPDAPDFMALALDEARQARGTTSPNPPVGAVVVRDGRGVARGHTQPPGAPHARAWVHDERAALDAIMVGPGTVLADDPLLTARPPDRPVPRQPLRVLVDSRGRIPPSARALGPDARTLVATTAASPSGWRA